MAIAFSCHSTAFAKSPASASAAASVSIWFGSFRRRHLASAGGDGHGPLAVAECGVGAGREQPGDVIVRGRTWGRASARAPRSRPSTRRSLSWRGRRHPAVEVGRGVLRLEARSPRRNRPGRGPTPCGGARRSPIDQAQAHRLGADRGVEVGDRAFDSGRPRPAPGGHRPNRTKDRGGSPGRRRRCARACSRFTRQAIERFECDRGGRVDAESPRRRVGDRAVEVGLAIRELPRLLRTQAGSGGAAQGARVVGDRPGRTRAWRDRHCRGGHWPSRASAGGGWPRRGRRSPVVLLLDPGEPALEEGTTKLGSIR